jgi:hypothetical protein
MIRIVIVIAKKLQISGGVLIVIIQNCAEMNCEKQKSEISNK